MNKYTVKKAAATPKLGDAWDAGAWKNAAVADIANFRPESSDHRPDTKAKLLYDSAGVYGLFQVHDKYVRSVHMNFQDSVCKDSCVEFFVYPGDTAGYFNFEFSCGGGWLCYYVEDAARAPGGFKKFSKLTEDDASLVTIFRTHPGKIDPEITEDTTWRLGFFAPYSFFERYAGKKVSPAAGDVWRANFYKCGDGTSHKHWASWNPVSELNFHLPKCFGELVFE